MPLAVSRKFNSPCYEQRTKKTGICLHYTAGSSVAGAVAWWKTKNPHIGTPYIIDRDGTIYQVFDSDYWAWHLGINNAAQDQRLIGIELVNWGPIQKRGEGIYSPVGYTTAVVGSEVLQTAKPWKGVILFQRFTDPQLASLRELVDDLCTRYKIPKVLAPPEWRTAEKPWPGAATHNGILAHEHFRSDKYDMGPAFDWSRLIV